LSSPPVDMFYRWLDTVTELEQLLRPALIKQVPLPATVDHAPVIVLDTIIPMTPKVAPIITEVKPEVITLDWSFVNTKIRKGISKYIVTNRERLIPDVFFPEPADMMSTLYVPYPFESVVRRIYATHYEISMVKLKHEFVPSFRVEGHVSPQQELPKVPNRHAATAPVTVLDEDYQTLLLILDEFSSRVYLKNDKKRYDSEQEEDVPVFVSTPFYHDDCSVERPAPVHDIFVRQKTALDEFNENYNSSVPTITYYDEDQKPVLIKLYDPISVFCQMARHTFNPLPKFITHKHVNWRLSPCYQYDTLDDLMKAVAFHHYPFSVFGSTEPKTYGECVKTPAIIDYLNPYAPSCSTPDVTTKTSSIRRYK
jgi:hypothetical protein